MNPLWCIAVKNLMRNKRRNLATGCAIGIGFAALLALGGYTIRVKNFLTVYAIYIDKVGHMVIYPKDGLDHYTTRPSRYSFDEEHQKIIDRTLAQTPAVDFFGGQLIGSGLVGNSCKSMPFIAKGLAPDLDEKVRLSPAMKRWARRFIDYSRGKGLWNYPPEFGAIALSEGLARLLGKPKVVSDFPGDKPPLVLVDCKSPDHRKLIASDANVQLVSGRWSGGMSALDGEVVAHFSTGNIETNNAALFTSLNHLQDLYQTKNVTFYSAWLKDGADLNKVIAEVSADLKAQGLSLDIYPWDDERISPLYSGTMNFLYTMVGFISSILSVIIAFSIFNATTITVIERSEEVGMMRSLGYSRRLIRTLFIRESMVLALVSMLTGGLLGGFGIFCLNNAGITFTPPGVAGAMPLLLTPNTTLVVSAALVIFVLAVATTFFAILRSTGRRIPALLSGAQW